MKTWSEPGKRDMWIGAKDIHILEQGEVAQTLCNIDPKSFFSNEVFMTRTWQASRMTESGISDLAREDFVRYCISRDSVDDEISCISSSIVYPTLKADVMQVYVYPKIYPKMDSIQGNAASDSGALGRKGNGTISKTDNGKVGTADSGSIGTIANGTTGKRTNGSNGYGSICNDTSGLTAESRNGITDLMTSHLMKHIQLSRSQREKSKDMLIILGSPCEYNKNHVISDLTSNCGFQYRDSGYGFPDIKILRAMFA